MGSYTCYVQSDHMNSLGALWCSECNLKYWKPQKEVVPTKKGLCLRTLEYIAIKELLTEIGRALPELDGVVPCYVQSDHMNQLGALRCLECNPIDYENW